MIAVGHQPTRHETRDEWIAAGCPGSSPPELWEVDEIAFWEDLPVSAVYPQFCESLTLVWMELPR